MYTYATSCENFGIYTNVHKYNVDIYIYIYIYIFLWDVYKVPRWKGISILLFDSVSLLGRFHIVSRQRFQVLLLNLLLSTMRIVLESRKKKMKPNQF